jgi:drug/metabolite transporter (DMT)-like permease
VPDRRSGRPPQPLSPPAPGAGTVASHPWSWANRSSFLLMVTFWGMNYLFVRIGLDYSGAFWLALLRAGVGTMATWVLVTPLHAWGHLDGRGRRDAMLLGLPNTAAFFVLWFLAARSVLPGIASVVIYTFPLWVALLSAPVLGHRLSPRHWVSVTAGFGGVTLISQVWAVGGSAVAPLAVLELLGASLSWAVGTVLFQRRFAREEMLEANAFQLLGGTLALLVLTLLFAPSPIPAAAPVLVGSVLWMGVLGTAVAYTIWFYLLGRTRAATLSAYVFLVPVVALTASAIVLGERLSLAQFVGVALVLGSVYGIGGAPGAQESPSEALPAPAE